MLSPTGRLGRQLREFASGGPLAEELRLELAAYAAAPIDETRVEALHRATSDAVQKTRASVVWWCCSLRLAENLQVARQLTDRADREHLDLCFMRWKAVLQFGHRQAAAIVPKKVSDAEAYHVLYRLRAQAFSEWGHLEPLLRAAEHLAGRPERSQAQLLMEGLLAAVMTTGAYLTMDLPVADGPPPELTVLAILDDKPTTKKVPGGPVGKGLAVPLLAQEFSSVLLDQWPCDSFHAMPVNEPRVIDGLALATSFQEIRAKLVLWQASPAEDLPACVVLSTQRKLSEMVWGVSSPDTPSLPLLDVLAADGWVVGRQAPRGRGADRCTVARTPA